MRWLKVNEKSETVTADQHFFIIQRLPANIIL